jgi:hypothetical protein
VTLRCHFVIVLELDLLILRSLQSTSEMLYLLSPLVFLRLQNFQAPGKPRSTVAVSQQRLSRESIAELHERRLRGLPAPAASVAASTTGAMNAATAAAAAVSAPAGGATAAKGVGGDMAAYQRSMAVRAQIQAVRANQGQKWRKTSLGRKRVYTVADLEGTTRTVGLACISSCVHMRSDSLCLSCARLFTRAAKESDRKSLLAQFGSETARRDPRRGSLSDKDDPDVIGKRALELTNEFRKTHKLPPLQWHQHIANIGKVHSKDMGEGRMPFAHDGFSERVQKYPFPSRSAAENLAMSGGLSDPAKVAVDGWIQSPGYVRGRTRTFCVTLCLAIGFCKTF